MKTIFILLLSFFTFYSCNNKNEYVINGSFKAVPTEKWIYLEKFDFENGYIRDSVEIKQGKFRFAGSIHLPDVYSLRYNPKDVFEELPIFLDPGKFEVVIDPINLELNSEINGGVLNEEYKEFIRIKKKRAAFIDGLNLDEPEHFEDNYIKMIRVGEELEKKKKDFIKSNMHSPLSIYLLENSFSSLPLEEQGNLLSNFMPSVYHMNLYKLYRAKYENQVKLLGFTPAFSLDENGLEKIDVDFSKTTILKTLIAKNPNKSMYIDIWGTWCGPCIASFPDIKDLQQKFSDKDLIFVYLCVGSLEDEWTKMIHKENLIGQHYLLGNGLLDRLNREAHVTGFPRYILINKEGKVCLEAPRPHSKNIEKTLLALAN